MKRKLFTLMAVLLLVLLTLVGSFLYGFLCNERRLPPYSLARKAYNWSREQITLRSIYFFLKRNVIFRDRTEGTWHRTSGFPGAQDFSADQRQAMVDLLAIGYLSGYEQATEFENVTTYIPELSYNGLNLYTSGHAQEAALMDMKVQVLHKWAYEFRDAFPNHPHPEGETKALRGQDC